MKNVVEILDNKVSKSLQNKIEKYLLHDNFAWYYQDQSLDKSTPKKYKNKTKDSFDDFQFFHTFVNQGKINSPHINIIIDLLKELKMETAKILRCKANLKFKTKTTKKHNVFHVDLPYKHRVMMYYVNDSDGDTYFKIGKTNKKISPKKGRVLLFNGNIMHAANHPRKTKKRLIINFDMV